MHHSANVNPSRRISCSNGVIHVKDREDEDEESCSKKQKTESIAAMNLEEVMRSHENDVQEIKDDQNSNSGIKREKKHNPKELLIERLEKVVQVQAEETGRIFSIGERMAAQGEQMVESTNNIFKLLAWKYNAPENLFNK
jgi:hypothetical protein